MRQIPGQISFFDIKPKNEKNEGLGGACETCDVEWCSIKCFIRRGFMWDRVHRFAKDSSGKNLLWAEVGISAPIYLLIQ